MIWHITELRSTRPSKLRSLATLHPDRIEVVSVAEHDGEWRLGDGSTWALSVRVDLPTEDVEALADIVTDDFERSLGMVAATPTLWYFSGERGTVVLQYRDDRVRVIGWRRDGQRWNATVTCPAALRPLLERYIHDAR
jgi:hypothetical protein